MKNMAYANRNSVGISHYLANSLKTKWLKPSERNLILNDVSKNFDHIFQTNQHLTAKSFRQRD